MNHQKLHINKSKKQSKKSLNKFLSILILLVMFSCNIFDSNLIGEYRIKEIKGGGEANKKIESLFLKTGGVAEIKYSDTIIKAKWKEINVQELHYIEFILGGTIHELHVIKDSSIELYFVSGATDFRGGFYDSLTFIKVK
jgi:hypothetical protein